MQALGEHALQEPLVQSRRAVFGRQNFPEVAVDIPEATFYITSQSQQAAATDAVVATISRAVVHFKVGKLMRHREVNRVRCPCEVVTVQGLMPTRFMHDTATMLLKTKGIT